MFKYTKHFLKKLETLLEELEYTVRYEKGNFQSGYCIVENRKIVVINRFFDTEGRINVLLDIIGTLAVPEVNLTEKSGKLYQQILSNTLDSESDSENESAPSN